MKTNLSNNCAADTKEAKERDAEAQAGASERFLRPLLCGVGTTDNSPILQRLQASGGPSLLSP